MKKNPLQVNKKYEKGSRCCATPLAVPEKTCGASLLPCFFRPLRHKNVAASAAGSAPFFSPARHRFAEVSELLL